MMRGFLFNLVNMPPPAPWREGDNIPWHDPGFSERMLQQHLSQEHDRASRRSPTIDAHVDWIHRHLLKERPATVLDLGCGPGLYASRLARLGHTCVGIDYSPASIEYATDLAAREHLRCEYRCQDMREADYGISRDLIMLIFGELNVFRPSHAQAILKKAREALTEGGFLLLEPHTDATVRMKAVRGRHWYAAACGLFSERPHLCLEESHWDSETRTTTIRYIVVDAESGALNIYAQTFQAYSDDEYRAILNDCGFDQVRFFPSLTGATDESQEGLEAIVAVKGA
jgi:SAM-dependent methyltransferase